MGGVTKGKGSDVMFKTLQFILQITGSLYNFLRKCKQCSGNSDGVKDSSEKQWIEDLKRKDCSWNTIYEVIAIVWVENNKTHNMRIEKRIYQGVTF